MLVGSSVLAWEAVNEGAEAWPAALVPDPPGDNSPSTCTSNFLLVYHVTRTATSPIIAAKPVVTWDYLSHGCLAPNYTP